MAKMACLKIYEINLIKSSNFFGKKFKPLLPHILEKYLYSIYSLLIIWHRAIHQLVNNFFKKPFTKR